MDFLFQKATLFASRCDISRWLSTPNMGTTESKGRMLTLCFRRFSLTLCVSSPPSPTPTQTPSTPTHPVSRLHARLNLTALCDWNCSLPPTPIQGRTSIVVLFRQEVEEGSFHSKSLMSLRWQWLPWRGRGGERGRIGGWGGWGGGGLEIKRNQSSLEVHCLRNQQHWLGGSGGRMETWELLCRHSLGINCSGCPGLLWGTAVSTAGRWLPLRGWWLSAAFYGEQQRKHNIDPNVCKYFTLSANYFFLDEVSANLSVYLSIQHCVLFVHFRSTNPTHQKYSTARLRNKEHQQNNILPHNSHWLHPEKLDWHVEQCERALRSNVETRLRR